MRKLNIIAYLGFALMAFILMSNNGGRANVAGQGATGAPGEGTCANMGCHDDGTFNTGLELALIDQAGNIVEEYSTGMEYQVRLTNTATGALAYGFQVTSLNVSNQYFGTWQTDSSGSQIVELTNRTYVEQAGSSCTNILTAFWSVDSSLNPGDITFYASTNAVNNNGSPTGDGTAVASLTIPQMVLSNENLADEIALVLAPNPATDWLNIQLDQDFESIKILNVVGKLIMESQQRSFDISSLPKGTYLVKVELENSKIATKKLLKI